jgi:hypothetical protein
MLAITFRPVWFTCYQQVWHYLAFQYFDIESGRFGALKSDSIHHFFRNACTKSESFRFSQFSGCCLIYTHKRHKRNPDLLELSAWSSKWLMSFNPEKNRNLVFLSDSTHHFFRNACTKSESFRFSQFSGCCLILSVYILMSFDFPFARLFGVR